MNNTLTDKEILERYAKDRNKAWLGIVLERYTLILLGVCNKYINDEEQAKDTVQHVFIKALAILEVQSIDNLGGWLYRVAKNECLDLLRKKNHYHNNQDHLEHLPSEDIDIQQLLEQETTIQKLLIAVGTLKEEQRICIELFYLQQKSYQEIVEITKFDIKQVKSNIQNAKRNLKIKLEH